MVKLVDKHSTIKEFSFFPTIKEFSFFPTVKGFSFFPNIVIKLQGL